MTRYFHEKAARVKPLRFLVVSAARLIADQREAQVPPFFLASFWQRG
jgi:hypothetical protein